MKIEPLIQMPTAWTGVTDRFGVHLFEGKLTIADMDRIEAVGSRWHGGKPLKIVELVVIFPSDARMTPEERKRMARLIKRWEHNRVASATVLLAAGVVGAMHRSVLTALQFLAPPPHPVKVFRETAKAVTWLSPHVKTVCGDGATTESVQSAVAAFCVAFTERRDRP